MSKDKGSAKSKGKGKQAKSHEINPRKVFVRGLPTSLTDKGFEKFFEKHVGEVATAMVIVDKETRNSKGCGFIIFSRETAAQNAVKSQPFFCKGKMLHLAADGDNGKSDEYEDIQKKLLVERLPWHFTDELLYKHFATSGAEVEAAKVFVDQTTGGCGGRGIITFASREYAKLALQKPQFVEGNSLDVRRSDSDERKADSGHRVLVKCLPSTFNDESLYKFVAKNIGKVAYAQVNIDEETGKSRGFGFVVFKESPKGIPALKKGHFIDGKALEFVVDGEQNQSKDVDRCTLFVKGLPLSLRDKELYKFFVDKRGDCVKTAKVFLDRETGESKRCGHVVFQSSADAEAATQSSYFMNQKLLKVEIRDAGLAATKASTEGCELFVQQLHWEVEDEELFQYFSGKFSDKVKAARVVMNFESGLSKGFGFVTFASKVAAANALKGPHYLRRRELIVRLAEKREETGDKGKGKGKRDAADGNRTIVLRGLPADVDDEDLYDYFAGQGGNVESARVKVDKWTEESTGMAFVILSTIENARQMTQKSHTIKGNIVSVESDCDLERRLLVRCLPYDLDDKGLHRYFSNCVGPVQSSRIVLNEQTGESRGFGIVVMANRSSIEAALNMVHVIDGRPVEVKRDEGGKGKGAKDGKGKGKKGKWEGGYEETNDLPPLALLRPEVYKKLHPEDNRLDGASKSASYEETYIAEPESYEETYILEPEIDDTEDAETTDLVFSTSELALVAQEALCSLQLQSVGIDAKNTCRLLVKGLPPDFDKEELSSLLASAGNKWEKAAKVWVGGGGGDESEKWATTTDMRTEGEEWLEDWSEVVDESAEQMKKTKKRKQGETQKQDDISSKRIKQKVATATDVGTDGEEWLEDWSEAVEEPAVEVKKAKKRKQGESQTQEENIQNHTSSTHAVQTVKSELGDWIPMISKTHGGIYYYNSKTGESKAANWKPMVSRSTGDIYFYNTETGESRTEC